MLLLQIHQPPTSHRSFITPLEFKTKTGNTTTTTSWKAAKFAEVPLRSVAKFQGRPKATVLTTDVTKHLLVQPPKTPRFIALPHPPRPPTPGPPPRPGPLGPPRPPVPTPPPSPHRRLGLAFDLAHRVLNGKLQISGWRSLPSWKGYVLRGSVPRILVYSYSVLRQLLSLVKPRLLYPPLRLLLLVPTTATSPPPLPPRSTARPHKPLGGTSTKETASTRLRKPHNNSVTVTVSEDTTASMALGPDNPPAPSPRPRIPSRNPKYGPDPNGPHYQPAKKSPPSTPGSCGPLIDTNEKSSRSAAPSPEDGELAKATPIYNRSPRNIAPKIGGDD
ncbi:hypothetical protein BJ170DRAFT_686211 [Xylariales sp. AK1849]|nr:hypothetical protein BJ170DRAFT_686211 [Xylariales sp. AK1849]